MIHCEVSFISGEFVISNESYLKFQIRKKERRNHQIKESEKPDSKQSLRKRATSRHVGNNDFFYFGLF